MYIHLFIITNIEIKYLLKKKIDGRILSIFLNLIRGLSSAG